MKQETLYNIIEKMKFRSAWETGVKNYALGLLDTDEKINLENKNCKELEKMLLNGADDWKQYSWGGCSFIYDGQIAENLATPSELKRTDDGRLKPNKNEEWLDTQARALYQAFRLIWLTLKEQEKTTE